jgi:hypothetical protein
MDGAKKIVTYLLISIVLLASFVSILSVWEIISLEDVMFKIMKTLVIIFGASLIILFIFNLIYKRE